MREERGERRAGYNTVQYRYRYLHALLYISIRQSISIGGITFFSTCLLE